VSSDEETDRLPEFLAAAFIAAHLGVTLTHAHRHYVKRMPALGEYWVHVAAQIRADMSDHMGRILGGQSAER